MDILADHGGAATDAVTILGLPVIRALTSDTHSIGTILRYLPALIEAALACNSIVRDFKPVEA